MSNRYHDAKRYLNDFDIEFRHRDILKPVKDGEGNPVLDEKGREKTTLVAKAEPAIDVIDSLVEEVRGRQELLEAVPGIDKRFIAYFRDVTYIHPPFEQETPDKEAEFNIDEIFHIMMKPKGANVHFEPTGIFYDDGFCLLRIRTHIGDRLKLGEDLLFDLREFQLPLSELLNYKQRACDSQSQPYGPAAKFRIVPGFPLWYEFKEGKPVHTFENLAVRFDEFDGDHLREVLEESLGWDAEQRAEEDAKED